MSCRRCSPGPALAALGWEFFGPDRSSAASAHAPGDAPARTPSTSLSRCWSGEAPWLFLARDESRLLHHYFETIRLNHANVRTDLSRLHWRVLAAVMKAAVSPASTTPASRAMRARVKSAWPPWSTAIALRWPNARGSAAIPPSGPVLKEKSLHMAF